MSDTKWTAGPWVVAEHHPNNEIATVAHVGSFQVGIQTPGYPGGNYRDTDLSAEREDAHLIAAAPELYEALDTLIAVVGLTPIRGNLEALQESVDGGNKALAKARGQS